MRYAFINHSYESYPVDVWDAIQIVVGIPKMKGSNAYAKSYRSTMCDIFQWLEVKCEGPDGSLCPHEVPMLRNEALTHCRDASLRWVQEVSANVPGSIERESAQAKADAYALVHDLFREGL